jgi:hypothetical protein
MFVIFICEDVKDQWGPANLHVLGPHEIRNVDIMDLDLAYYFQKTWSWAHPFSRTVVLPFSHYPYPTFYASAVMGKTSSRDHALSLYWRLFGELILEFWFIKKELFLKYRPSAVDREFCFPKSERAHSWTSTSPPPVSRLSRKCGSLDVSHLCGPPRPVTRIVYHFHLSSFVCSIISTGPIYRLVWNCVKLPLSLKLPFLGAGLHRRKGIK